MNYPMPLGPCGARPALLNLSGLARSVREETLFPGHPHLRQGVAFSYDDDGAIVPRIITLRRPGTAVRIPQSLSTGLARETGWSVLDYELREQKAQTLGTLSGQVVQALAAVRAFDAQANGSDKKHQRGALLDEAADRVWAFMIQRELCGFGNWDAVVRDYGIPREVLNRVGQVQRKAI